MPYVLNTPQDQADMLAAIGISSLDELFDMVPADLRLDRALNIPAAMSEMELTSHMQSLSSRTQSADDTVCFLGGGSYDHFIPAVVDYVSSRGEFYTSYTPYQAEASQGNLQAFFEYQTLITQLTGMDVSNASLYDGGSSAAEAVLMCIGATRRNGKVVIPACVHPEYRQIVETFLTNLDVKLEVLETPDGLIRPDELAAAIDETTACVLLQQPNFFGSVQEMKELVEVVHKAGALAVVSVDPISLGLLTPPGSYDADIVVAEGQALGTPMGFGGPYLGIMACKDEFVRRMPGRLAGQTVDRRGKRCWALTLQTREQHIRRERATSNICTNQGLFALRASVYLAQMGPQGLREVANLCLQKSRHAAAAITANDRFTLAFDASTFKEFVIRDAAGDVDSLVKHAMSKGYFAGVPLGQWYPDLSDCFLVAVTERRTKAEIEGLAECLAAAPAKADVVKS
ncbi:MAG: aminomethyl-transferring glycine dehydrogenase subunit GcvPA [Pirellulales bacterium]|nr:aminomethyl-transferring glycine dehydrogenase subunit GcvPA [Pirellulales bacterium]